MEIMAVPNPKAYYIINPENMEAVKKIEKEDLIKTIKSEAYREFATRIKKRKIEVLGYDDYVIDFDDIDYILRELEGEL